MYCQSSHLSLLLFLISQGLEDVFSLVLLRQTCSPWVLKGRFSKLQVCFIHSFSYPVMMFGKLCSWHTTPWLRELMFLSKHLYLPLDHIYLYLIFETSPKGLMGIAPELWGFMCAYRPSNPFDIPKIIIHIGQLMALQANMGKDRAHLYVL